MKHQINSLAVLTSGGDAPGMNAAIRAVVRTAIYHGIKIFGVRRGYQGLIENDIFEMNTLDVANIIQRGGTILKTARSKAFLTTEGRKTAHANLEALGINGLIVIGGDGSFKGAQTFSNEFDMPTIGIPGTIDKDISGTDYTIGFDTAVNTAVECIDKIRDTADAHDRLFVVEVMGRDAGYIALNSGISCGAEDIFIPETHTNISEFIKDLRYDKKRKKYMRIVVVAEGDEYGGAEKFREMIQKRFPSWEVRSAILGHLQRGGAPTAYDRVQASKMGFHAVEAILQGERNIMIGTKNSAIAYTKFEDAHKMHSSISEDNLRMAHVLSS